MGNSTPPLKPCPSQAPVELSLPTLRLFLPAHFFSKAPVPPRPFSHPSHAHVEVPSYSQAPTTSRILHNPWFLSRAISMPLSSCPIPGSCPSHSQAHVLPQASSPHQAPIPPQAHVKLSHPTPRPLPPPRLLYSPMPLHSRPLHPPRVLPILGSCPSHVPVKLSSSTRDLAPSQTPSL